MIKRKRLDIYTDDCRTHNDVSMRIEVEIERAIEKELRLSYDNIISISEKNYNDSSYEVVIYYKENR